jgi:hypothetical protein
MEMTIDSSRQIDGAPAAKPEWETPTIEEVDLASTEAAPVVYGGVDAGIYHS